MTQKKDFLITVKRLILLAGFTVMKHTSEHKHKLKKQVPEMDEDTAKIEGSWYICNWMWNQERKPQQYL